VKYVVKDLASEKSDDKTFTGSVRIEPGESIAEFRVPITSFLEIFEDGLTLEAIVILQSGNGYNVVDLQLLRSNQRICSPLARRRPATWRPSSRCASCMKPNGLVPRLDLCVLWKKETILPALTNAGTPYQSLGERTGAGTARIRKALIWAARARIWCAGRGKTAVFVKDRNAQ
jgi:hypothetical protein